MGTCQSEFCFAVHSTIFELCIDVAGMQDYVEGMWRMLQQDTPDDFVLATGETHPVKEFVEKAFAHVGIIIRYVFASLG